MARFRVLNSNIFPLPGNPHMLHLGTIGYGLREFIVMRCIRGPKAEMTYIEEVVMNTVDFQKDVFANCKFIEEDALAEDLARFSEEKGLLDVEKTTGQIVETGNSRWLFGQQGMTGSKR